MASDSLDAAHAERGQRLAQLAHARGLNLTEPDGERTPIPISPTPLVLEACERERRSRLAAMLIEGALAVGRWAVSGPRRRELLPLMDVLERRLSCYASRSPKALVTARVDFLEMGAVQALETNTTVPAMQGYSDIAADSYIDVVGGEAGLGADELAELHRMNGSNVAALHAGLVRAFTGRCGHAPARIALLCLRFDAQLSELEQICARFRALGSDTDVVHPDQAILADGLRVAGRRYDLVYQHVFVRHLEGCPHLEDLFTAVHRADGMVLKQPATHVGLKANLAWLSQALVEPELGRAIGLPDDLRASLAAHVPWTRLLQLGSASDASGEMIPDLVGHVAAHPEGYVLKRVRAEGGQGVYIGAEIDEEAHRERLLRDFGAALDWPTLCRRAASRHDRGVFVVQEHVRTSAGERVLCTPDRAQVQSCVCDYSAYTSYGLGVATQWGDLCRAAPAAILDVSGGSGIVPVLDAEVARRLAAANRRGDR